jgi:hypothetical protein
MAFRRLATLILALIVIGAGMAVMRTGAAMAQDQGWSLRDLLFPRRQERAQSLERFPPPPKAKKQRAKRPPVVVAPRTVEKAPDARVILVIGDFMASGLADGLEAAFEDNRAIRIVDRSNGSSGFVRNDHYDWTKEVGPIVEAEKPAAVIAMIGSNDRQQMQVGETRETMGSAAWTTEYKARTQALGKALAAAKARFLWVGMPAFKSAKATSDMLAFNDIYRAAAQDNGGEFIDVWDGFVDETGAFVTNGPDINGQPVRLRGDDGINVSKAGRRKLAFYTEKPLMKILGLASPAEPGAASAPPAGEPVKPPEAATAPPAAIDRTVPMLLSDPALDGGTELLGGSAESRAGQPSREAAKTAAVPAGRADNFAWPAGKAVPNDKTTAVNP